MKERSILSFNKKGVHKMKLFIGNSDEEMAQKVLEVIQNESRKKSNLTMGLATGGTPLALYRLWRKSDIDTSNMRSINLDEYVGISKDHPNSYHHYMVDNLFKDKPFLESFLPNGKAKNVAEECERYENLIKRFPIDIQLLGIGNNGHIGFNEPGTLFNSKTHIVELTSSTREANRRFFEEDEKVPTHAITMGISTIVKAKKIILIAKGESKSEALYHAFKGKVTENCPASVLQNHPNILVVANKEALKYF